PHALARDVQSQGRVPDRGHPRAARHPGRVHGLGALDRGACPRRRPGTGLDLAALLRGDRIATALLPGGLSETSEVTVITGRATEEGTARYAGRARRDVLPEHFRLTERGLRLSSVGMGTYLGREDDATDGLYRRSIARALERSLNVLDSAINY